MSRIRKKRSSLAVAMAVVMAATAGLIAFQSVAGAHKFSETSTLTARYGHKQDAFKGRVKADKKACKRKRQVDVFKLRKDKSDKFVGTDTTGNGGYWSVPSTNPNGRFYAKTPPKFTKKYGHRHNCRRDWSETVDVN